MTNNTALKTAPTMQAQGKARIWLKMTGTKQRNPTEHLKRLWHNSVSRFSYAIFSKTPLLLSWSSHRAARAGLQKKGFPALPPVRTVFLYVSLAEEALPEDFTDRTLAWELGRGSHTFHRQYEWLHRSLSLSSPVKKRKSSPVLPCEFCWEVSYVPDCQALGRDGQKGQKINTLTGWLYAFHVQANTITQQYQTQETHTAALELLCQLTPKSEIYIGWSFS